MVGRLKDDFTRFGAQMKVVRRSLERWTVFVNPYFRLESVVAELHARLDSVDLKSDDLPELPMRNEDFVRFQKTMTRLSKKYAKAAELGIALRMICPVWGEAFVNLLIFLLAKESVKSNNRLYEDLLRKEIDIRIGALHLHCDGFKAPLDRENGAVRDFLTVMNSRNDFLHGNVDPKRLAVDEIYFEGKMPLFMRHQTFTERSLAPRLRHVEPNTVKLDIYRVSSFIAYVLEHLEPKVRRTVRQFMETPLPGWRPDTGRAGILFSDVVADFVIPDEPEPSDNEAIDHATGKD